MDIHTAVKALKASGFNDEQSEKIVEVITELQNISVVAKADLTVATESVKTDIGTIKTDLDWIKKLTLAVGIAVVIAALKYIFIG
ncbi:CCDC90 family protein [Photorhabdus hainanensis]|uniref:CCDC90 family protein n=1 Tax=Photorhabdus hainanensis TaxID=1004166 RepID=UPI001FE59EAF|nr:CCDC90 family protein [Photorhabdus hainanensis]